MTISNDYLDIDSQASTELLAPAKQILEHDSVIKTIKIFFRSVELNVSAGRKFKCDYNPILEMPESDLELFKLLKDRISAPPQDEDEMEMTPEELLKERDPEGILEMPLESESVQRHLTEVREDHEQDPFQKVQEAYQKALEGLCEWKKPTSLEQLEITVTYIKKPDVNHDLTLRLTAHK